MDNPRPEGADKERLERMIDSLLYANAEEGIDLCFSFDTTGSMYACLEKVRQNISSTCTKLLADIPKLRIAIIAHGDYCDDHSGSYVVKVLEFSSNVKQITNFVNNVASTGGGDLPEAYELVLRDAQKLNWRLRAAKALVMIGDSPPHAASYTSEKIWWRDEITKLYRELGCKIYAVQAYNDPVSGAFYQEIARRTGGVHLPLESFNLITEMFMAVCYKERSVDFLKNFRSELQKERRMNPQMEKIFNKLEHETAPPALGQQNSDWWDASRDRGQQQYRYDDKAKRYVSEHKSIKVAPRSDAGSYETAIRAERLASAANTPAFSTRTGGSILDPSRSLKKDPAKAAKAEWTPADDDPYTVRCVRGCIFEVVLKSSLSPEELSKIASAQPLPPKPPTKIGKALALIVTPADRKAMAIKRLMRDMAEVHRNPIHNVAAAPLESNMLMWHCSLAGPASSAYNDVVFHLTMEFPINYPKKPPRVMICTTLIHPSVFGKWVCLDMLELGGWAADEEEERIFTGWSSGYSVLSILLQLQAFLFEGAMEEKHFVEEARKRAKAFVCADCGHGKGGKVHPPLPNIPPPPVPVASVPKKPAAKAPAKPAAAKNPHIAAPKPAAPLAHLSSTPAIAAAPVVKAPPVRSHLTSLVNLPLGTAVAGTVVRLKEGTGAWIKVGMSPVPLAFLPMTHISANFCKDIESVLKVGSPVVVYVLSVDAKNGRLSVSLLSKHEIRAFKEQPRVELEHVIVGAPRLGVVERVDRGGALVDCGIRHRVWGRLPLANATANPEGVQAFELFNVGDVITCVPTAIDMEGKSITLAARLTPRVTAVPSLPVAFLRKRAAAVAGAHCDDAEKALSESGFHLLSVEMIFKILERLTPYDVARLGRTCHFFHKLAADGTSYLFERNELVCFHTKLHFSEDILGVGINLENKLNGKLAYITTTFDLVSYQAFSVEKIRKASYKEPFTHWLPLYINPAHGAKSLPLVKEAMAKICADAYGKFEPWMILEVIPKLMNSMVVQVMSGKLYGSIMALEGYSAFHHLFLVLLEEYPELKAQVDDTIRGFLKSDSSRHKHEIPALGEWLPLLSVTETFSWEDVATAYLGEMFDRNVLWTLKAHAGLAHWPSSADASELRNRLRKTYEATIVSNHLLMFHVYFLDNVARPQGMSLKHLRELLDVRFGKPTWAMKEALMREVKRIRSFVDWGSFFTYIHVRPPSEPELLDWLKRAQSNSERKRYHRASDFA